MTTQHKPMPAERNSITHKFTVGGTKGYMTVGLLDSGQPGELFLTVQRVGTLERGLFHTVALLVSIALQHGVPLAKICDKLAGIHFEPCGVTCNKDIPMCRSIVDYVARWLALHYLPKPKEESQS